MSIRRLGILTVCVVLCCGSARAQSPVAAGTAPSVNVSLGTEYVGLGMTPSSQVGLIGLDASAEGDFLKRIGLKLDVGYARAGNVFASGRHSDVLSYLGGPVLHLWRREGFAVYVQGLLGGARVTGPAPAAVGGFGSGYANELAWSAGLGVEHRFSGGLALRFGGDYMHTAYFSPTGTLQGQTDFRAVSSVVYYFHGGRY